MHKRSAAYAAMRRLSVRLSVTFVYSIRMYPQFFSLPASHTNLVFFHTKRYGYIPTASPLTAGGGGWNAGGVGNK